MPSGFKLTEFSDKEFLYLLAENADSEGWADSRELAELPELAFLAKAYKFPRHAIASRLSWLWRYGVVEREHLADEHGNLRYIAGDTGRPKWGQRWRLTPEGEQYALGRLTARQVESLAKMPPAEAAELLAQAALSAPLPGRMLVIRRWRYGIAQNGGSRG